MESIVTFTMRLYAGDADLQIMVDITNAGDAVDQLEEATTVDEVRDDFLEPGFDPYSNIAFWFQDSEPVAFMAFFTPMGDPAITHPAALIWFKIRPDARGSGVEEQMMAWAEERQMATFQATGHQLQFEAISRDHETTRRAMLERFGFKPVRYFLRMVRPLNTALPEPVIGEGLRIIASTLSNQEYADLHNEIWVDHFGFQPWTAEMVAHYRSSNYDPHLDLLAITANGTPAGFCWCSIRPEENKRNGRNDGWIGMLGVRRAFRSQGVGRALLREGMRRLYASGADQARLGVDAASPTKATKLYESEGFEQSQLRILYARD